VWVVIIRDVLRAKAGNCHTIVEGKCNQTPPRLRFLPCPENLPKPNSLAGGKKMPVAKQALMVRIDSV